MENNSKYWVYVSIYVDENIYILLARFSKIDYKTAV